MLSTVVSIMALLLVATFTHTIASRLKVPYTILLFIVGLLITGIGGERGEMLSTTLRLTPELLFLVFLPVLLFDAGYSIKYSELKRNYGIIRGLAIVGLLVSTVVVGLGGKFLFSLFGIIVPIEVMLLFGVLISSTDPVAVLSIFKNLGVPKRLGLIFEGESLFNDGISVALFLIFLEIFSTGLFTNESFLSGLLLFSMMVIGGIIVGTVFGILFSLLVKVIRNNQYAEITLTMILAHAVFLLSERISHSVAIGGLDIKISGVIATAYAAILMGNYGKTKITPKVEQYMHNFRGFFSFIINSLVFLMMGMMVKHITIPMGFIRLPILLGIVSVLVGRVFGVYATSELHNLFSSKQNKIPSKRKVLLSWGSLRGALALMLVLLIPDSFIVSGRFFEFSIKQFILSLTIGAIVFSLVVQGLTLVPLVKKLNISGFIDLEKFEFLEAQIIIYHRILRKIRESAKEHDLHPKQYEQLIEKYSAKLEEARLKMQIFIHQLESPDILIEKALSLHALGIEKNFLHQMFSYNEIPEQLYHERHSKIEKQISRVQSGRKQIRGFRKPTIITIQGRDPIEKIMGILFHKEHSQFDDYVVSRAKYIVTSQVIAYLEKFKEIGFGYDSIHIQRTITLYEQFRENAADEIDRISENHEEEITDLHNILLNKGLMKTEEKLIKELYANEIVTSGIYKLFELEIDKELNRDYSTKCEDA